jgi:hypothetical protein
MLVVSERDGVDEERCALSKKLKKATKSSESVYVNTR